MTTTITLDWTRLLGFDQAPAPQTVSDAASITDPRLAQLGAKLGGKIGDKQGQTGFAVGPNSLNRCLRHAKA